MVTIRLLDNEADTFTELFIEGKFVAGWGALTLSKRDRGVVEAMLREVWVQAQANNEGSLRTAIEQVLRRTA